MLHYVANQLKSEKWYSMIIFVVKFLLLNVVPNLGLFNPVIK